MKNDHSSKSDEPHHDEADLLRSKTFVSKEFCISDKPQGPKQIQGLDEDLLSEEEDIPKRTKSNMMSEETATTTGLSQEKATQ